ncbi:PorP/SprF family type IX secretion system membrane protein [Croceivirga thetidis]|uniref:PorP/SprF family type IX secretion system membrane protein n=1 Tax=Croceivirga thetidis TaxID=2721623 RepID=A0ABX1GMU7_9FLAO|nr:PorP/SprF family type IX secretion system membrane protein [Croceivirga thetidis]NKI31228.1 PorP/SprF family type IX secretion system membrane protein [Croceivirga thetidis]
MPKLKTYITVFALLLFTIVKGQEESPFATYDVPAHNLLKFNRFLINPTFSTVREDKSYFNMQHRNQSVSFEDNFRAYFLSYSGRIGDRSGVGLGVFNQREGLVDNYGVLANYGYGIRLTQDSNFTFGANFIYYNSGINQNRANPIDADPALLALESTSLFSFQPGFNISYKNFDFGVFAENLFDYNIKTSESVTEFNAKTFSAHLQYTHLFSGGYGLFEDARLLSLARVRKVGETDLVFGGNFIMEMPKVGWVQLGYDTFYGAAAGVGFNVGKRVSLGYTVEQGFGTNFENFGINHEISLAYSFTPHLTEDRVKRDRRRKNKEDGYTEDIVENDDRNNANSIIQQKEDELAELRKRIQENNDLINQLLKNKDSSDNKKITELENTISKLMSQLNDKKLAASRANAEESKKAVVTNSKKKEFKESAGGRVIESLNIPGIRSGYYVIANVFRSEKYVTPFVEKLEKKGLRPGFFTNPRNNLKYVFVKRYGAFQNALKAYKTKIDGSYQEEVWIIKINGNEGTSADVKFDDESLNIEDGEKHVLIRLPVQSRIKNLNTASPITSPNQTSQI